MQSTSNAHRAAALLLAGTVLLAGPAAAAPLLGLDLRLQMSGGGEELASVEYSDGSESALSLGTYSQLGAGVVLTPLHDGLHALDLELFTGWASTSTGPENTDDRLVLGRLPVELLAYYRLTPKSLPVGLRVGGGVAAHLFNGVTGRGALDGLDVPIANALGWVVEVGVVYDLFTFNLRHTRMTYEVGPAALAMDASSFAGSIGLVFPLGEAVAPR